MAASSGVVVLCPNGRRQNVKVTPNTSILQVLEDACKKQGLNPEEYDIKHYNRKLDLSLSIRFSNVPNNAVLELCPASSKRQEKVVTIGLQLESGQRILKDFQPSSTLWDVVSSGIQSVNEGVPSDIQEPVCIYMRREIVGKEGLSNTTLRSLGLTSGKAIIRLIYRQKGAVCEQAHIASPLTKPVSELVIDNWNPEDAAPFIPKTNVGFDNAESTRSDNTEQGTSSQEPSKASVSAMESVPMSEDTHHEDCPKVPANTEFDDQAWDEGFSDAVQEPSHHWGAGIPLNANVSPSYQNPTQYSQTPVEAQESNVDQEPIHYWGCGRRLNEMTGESSGTSVEMEVDNANETTQSNGMFVEVDDDDDVNCEVHYLGERDALLFHLDDIPQVKVQEMPDEFYEFTVDDALYLLADLKRQRRELEERPLETTLLRLTKQVAKERQYRRTIIRIQFPSRHVLQACFSPSETGAVLKTFVQGFLQNPSQDFYLFTTPPKTLLNDNQTLYEMNLVPAAVVYFGAKDVDNGNILRKGLEKKVTKAKAVFKAASLARKAIQKEISMESPPQANEQQPPIIPIETPQAPANKPSSSTQGVQPQGKVPKWFKFGK